MTTPHSPARASLDYRIGSVRHFVNALNNLSRTLTGALYPVVDFVLRLWIGQAFILSGIVEWASLDAGTHSLSTVTGAGELDATAVVYVTAAIEVLGGLFLILGLGARFAAAFLVAATLWLHAQQGGSGVDPALLLLSGWFIVAGAGPISFDRFWSGKVFRNQPWHLQSRSPIFAQSCHFGSRRCICSAFGSLSARHFSRADSGMPKVPRTPFMQSCRITKLSSKYPVQSRRL